MDNLQLYSVAPSIPEKLEFLERLSYNLWWCWNSNAIELFRRIDPQLWKDCDHNPFSFFSRLPQTRLDDLARNRGYMSHYRTVRDRFDAEVATGTPATGAIASFSPIPKSSNGRSG